MHLFLLCLWAGFSFLNPILGMSSLLPKYLSENLPSSKDLNAKAKSHGISGGVEMEYLKFAMAFNNLGFSTQASFPKDSDKDHSSLTWFECGKFIYDLVNNISPVAKNPILEVFQSFYTYRYKIDDSLVASTIGFHGASESLLSSEELFSGYESTTSPTKNFFKNRIHRKSSNEALFLIHAYRNLLDMSTIFVSQTSKTNSDFLKRYLMSIPVNGKAFLPAYSCPHPILNPGRFIAAKSRKIIQFFHIPCIFHHDTLRGYFLLKRETNQFTFSYYAFSSEYRSISLKKGSFSTSIEDISSFVEDLNGLL